MPNKKAQQDITVPPPVKSIKPGVNFYGHVNSKWIQHVNMPSYRSSYSISEEIEDKIEVNLEKIIKNAQEEIVNYPNKELDNNIILLGTLQQSVMDRGSQKENVKFVKDLITNLRCIRTTDDVARTIGEFSRFRISSPLTIYTSSEEKHSNVLRLNISPGTITLPDTSYYTVQGPGSSYILEAYNKLLTKLGEHFDIANINLFIGLERIIADAVENSRGDDEELIKGADLKKQYAYIPWDSLAHSAFGFTSRSFNEYNFLVTSNTWLKYLNRWFKTWNIENWRVWLSGIILIYCLPLLPPPFDTLHFEFFEKRLRGQQEKLPQHLLGLKLCKQWLSAPLGKEYLKCCVDDNIKRDVISLANEIRSTIIKRLEMVEWLDIATRKKAIKKVKSIHLGIAYPELQPKNPVVILNPEQVIRNILSLGTAEFEKDLKRANSELQPQKWTDSVFEVNAYYYNEGNRLVIPAGILNYPFYHIDSSDGMNFGGIGATIGHELTHAFDMEGKNYDEFGNKIPWWTSKDNRNYNQKTKAIIALYNKTEYFGKPINGTLTLSENIADLGGLAIALMALKARLEKKNMTDAAYKKELCLFFISYAVSWRVKEKKEKALQSLFTDMHAPPLARVNNIVRQFDDWYECFDVKPGNLLYTAPEERIRIF